MRRSMSLWASMLVALVLACSNDGGKEAATTAPGAGGAAAPAAPAPGQAGGTSVTGARMVLVRDQRLFVRGAGGDEQVLLRTPANTYPTFPMWSPSGDRIAFVQATVFTGQPNVDWGGDIYIIDAGGGAPRLVWKHDQAGAQVQGMAWTPDGAALLIGYQLTLIRDNKYQGQVQRIDRLDINSGNRTKVVDGGVYPSISRDGKRLSYLTQDDTGKGGLWVAAGDGSGAKQLLELGPRFAAIMGPRIAPDGSAIAFAAVTPQAAAPERRPSRGFLSALHGLFPRRAAAHGFPMDVWRVNVADSAVTRLTNFAEDEPFPAWSADTKTIYVIATGGLYELNADGSGLKKIGMGAFDGKIDLK